MTKKERNKINREIRIERILRDYYFKKWKEQAVDFEHAYILYKVHDYCLFVLENRI